MDSVVKRHNVNIVGSGQPMMLAHGFGCDQNMWRYIAPEFASRYKIVLFDYLGHGKADADAFNAGDYADLEAYARDVLDICKALDLRDLIFVGHSVSSMIGVLAANQQPDRFSRLVMIGPSPRYIDDEGYTGGFKRKDIEDLLDLLDSNHLGWSQNMAPVIMGNLDRPELGSELADSFCRTHPVVARHFARTTFLSDNRADLAKVSVPSLILQCRDDVIAPEAVGRFVHQQVRGSQFVQLKATGHCPNLSAPVETTAAIRDFLRQTDAAAAHAV